MPVRSLRITYATVPAADGLVAERVLHERRKVHEARRVQVERVVLDVLHDTDDLAPCVAVDGCSNALPERGGGLEPELASEILGDQSDAAARVDVGPRQVASRDDPRAHGLEEARRDELASRRRRRISGGERSAVDHDRRVVDERRPFHRQRAREAGGCDARQRGNRVEDLVLHAHELRRVAYELGRSPRPHGLDRGGVRESGIDVAQRRRTSGS